MNRLSQCIRIRGCLIAALLACLAAAVLGGCGNGSSSATAGGSSARITKTELIDQGDAICRETDEIQKASLAAYRKQQSSGPLQLDAEELVIKLAIPPVRAEIRELDALGAPEEDESTIAEWHHELKESLRSAERNPKLFVQVGGSPEFIKADELAKKYGFKDCADPL
jgi:hypothetical protein